MGIQSQIMRDDGFLTTRVGVQMGIQSQVTKDGVFLTACAGVQRWIQSQITKDNGFLATCDGVQITSFALLQMLGILGRVNLEWHQNGDRLRVRGSRAAVEIVFDAQPGDLSILVRAVRVVQWAASSTRSST